MNDNRISRAVLLRRGPALLALAGLGPIAACATRERAADPTGARPAPAGPQRVDVWWSIADNNPSVPPAWEDFKRRHPGWTGELTMGVTYEKFQASLAGGIVPDAYFGSFQTIQVAAYKKIFAPLDAYIARDKVNMDQYYFGSKAGAVFRGKIYGMPHHSNVRSVYVNQKAYRDAGLDPNKAPSSWDDFRLAIQRMKREEGPGQLDRIGYHPTWQIGGPTAIMYFQANGVPLLSADGTQLGFATPAGVEALKWVAETVAALGGKGALDEFQKRFNRGTGEALGRGATGIALAGIWVVPRDAMTADPTAQIAQWPVPGGPSARGKTFGYVAATSGVVPTAAPRPDAGWEFTKYQASVEGQRFIQEAEGSWDQACIASVANDPAALQKQPWRKRANELLGQARHTAYFPFPGAVDVEAAMNTAVNNMLAGKQGPDATMQEMKQQVQVVMDQYR
ncbi:MAG: extracellular solute-binding protein [Chloroflexi bacterium]|nr:extracellular solute-binding protein [Chloroflexota bacterium]